MKEDLSITPRLLRRHEAARYLGVSTAQLDALRLQGEVDAIPMPGRNGSAVRVPLYDVRDLDLAVDRWKGTAR